MDERPDLWHVVLPLDAVNDEGLDLAGWLAQIEQDARRELALRPDERLASGYLDDDVYRARTYTFWRAA